MNPLVITHAGCNDGKWCATVATLYYGEGNVDVYYASYRQPPPDVDGRDVLITDFSYPREVLLDLYSKAKSLKVLDHHASAEKDLEGLEFCHFDGNHSGAVLTWKHFFPDKPVPIILLHVEDYDLWRFKMPSTKCVVSGMYLNRDIMQDVRSLQEDGGLSAITLYEDWGQIALLVQENTITKLAKRSHLLDIGGYIVPAVNSTEYMSELGAVLSEGKPFAVVYNFKSDGKVAMSLRSHYGRQEGAVDVSEIAKLFGGGGHASASGGGSTIEDFVKMIIVGD